MRNLVKRSPAVGTDVPGIESGWLIAGLVIDNPSGSWLTLDLPYGPVFVPPYTLGFATTIAPAAQVIGVRYTNGPASFNSTQAGDPFVAYLFDEVVSNSPGSPFVPTLIEITPSVLTLQATTTQSTTTLITPPTSRRLRVYRTAFAYSTQALVGPNDGRSSPVEARFKGSSTANVFSMPVISPAQPFASDIFADGIDLAVGDSLDVQLTAFWQTVRVTVQWSVATV